MTCRHTPWKLLLLGAVLAASTLSSPAQDGVPIYQVKWRNDYGSALREAKDKGLPLVIDFGTKTCRYCVLLDQTTFRDPKVTGVMNERFIPLKVDAEVDSYLTSQLRISSFPTVVMAGPEGHILSTMVGYKEAGDFHEHLQRVLSKVSNPEWMLRDLEMANKWMQTGDYARAISALRTILEDGKSRPVQADADRLMKDLEQKAVERLARAKEYQDKGQPAEALETLTETIRIFPGLQAAKEASALVSQMGPSPEARSQQRARRAAELIVQARDFFKNREFIPCLDRCECLVGSYGDLPEGQEASQIAAEINSNPEWLQGAVDTMSDRLGSLYLALADALLKKGQPQRAEVYLQRIILAFPGSRQAEAAQTRLEQMQGAPRRVQSAGPP